VEHHELHRARIHTPLMGVYDYAPEFQPSHIPALAVSFSPYHARSSPRVTSPRPPSEGRWSPAKQHRRAGNPSPLESGARPVSSVGTVTRPHTTAARTQTAPRKHSAERKGLTSLLQLELSRDHLALGVSLDTWRPPAEKVSLREDANHFASARCNMHPWEGYKGTRGPYSSTSTANTSKPPVSVLARLGFRTPFRGGDDATWMKGTTVEDICAGLEL
jgi:hypothetical protein